MAKTKKAAEAPETPVEAVAPVEPETPQPEVVGEESEAKKNYRRLIEEYKAQNPVKYAQKEAQFIKHLDTL
jgi:hypothetical protein